MFNRTLYINLDYRCTVAVTGGWYYTPSLTVDGGWLKIHTPPPPPGVLSYRDGVAARTRVLFSPARQALAKQIRRRGCRVTLAMHAAVPSPASASVTSREESSDNRRGTTTRRPRETWQEALPQPHSTSSSHHNMHRARGARPPPLPIYRVVVSRRKRTTRSRQTTPQTTLTKFCSQQARGT